MFKPEFAKQQAKKFGHQMKKERKKQSLKQECLAKRASVNTQTIKGIESGTNVTLITIFKVARALDVDPSSILVEIEDI